MFGRGPPLEISDTTSSTDAEVRSPRTPTYAPISSTFYSFTPFDPSSLFKPINIATPRAKSPAIPPPPPKPLAWVWQCHLCRTRYPLGATRRCLIDGHYYCSGETNGPSMKKKRKNQSCSSEFDYIGWKVTAAWQLSRRNILKDPKAHDPQGCENCEFPSQCLYTPSQRPKDVNLIMPVIGSEPPYSGDALGDKSDGLSRFYKNPNATFESILSSATRTHIEKGQLEITDFYKPDGKPANSAEDKTSNSSIMLEIMKSVTAERRSLLSPIQEEVLLGDLGLQNLGDEEMEI